MSDRFARVALAAILAATVIEVGGCGAPRQADSRRENPADSARTREQETYPLRGIVRRVDPASGLVTIRHEAIPGLMDTMTMPFTIGDKASLDDMRPGDEVEGKLLVRRQNGEVSDFDLTDLVVSRPAAPSDPPVTAKAENAQRLQPGEPVPDFAMTDEEGRSLRLSDLRGKVVALTFVYTRCPLPEFCPRMDRKFAGLAEQVGARPGRAEGVRLLSVSFDPEHDTPSVLKAHARRQGAKPPLWTFAVATHPELARVAAPLGLSYGPSSGEYIHNLIIAVIDPDGKLVRLETGAAARDWSTTDLLKTMYLRMTRREE